MMNDADKEVCRKSGQMHREKGKNNNSQPTTRIANVTIASQKQEYVSRRRRQRNVSYKKEFNSKTFVVVVGRGSDKGILIEPINSFEYCGEFIRAF